MNIGILGGTFDPVHRGHLAVARAAQRACHLDRIYFVPADVPPHKQRAPITAFEHRYAMLALALRGHDAFVPSLIEGAARLPGLGRRGRQRPNYTIDTIGRFRTQLSRRDRLFFIIGIDAFVDFPTWYKPAELLTAVEFIVVSRPGFALTAQVVTDILTKVPGSSPRQASRIQVVGRVAEDVSSTAVRRTLASGRIPQRLLDPAVVEYIQKEHLYRARERT